MFSATRRWLRKNRTPIAIGAAAIGGTYLVGQYVVGKLNDARERSQLDKIAKDNIRRRFEQNQIDCSITVLALLPTLTENIIDALPAEQLTSELQQKKAERLQRAAEGALSEASSLQGDNVSLSSFQTGSFMHTSQLDASGLPRPKRTKAQLWNELKITSIVRAFTLIYSLSLLILLTRIQLNLLGRLNYLSSVVSLSQPPPPERAHSISLENHEDLGIANFGNDFETNRRFLTFSWYLLHRGYARILERVRAAVEEVFGGTSPNEGLTQQRLSELVLEVRKKIEGSTEQERYNTRWLQYVLPPREEEESLLVDSGVITPPSTSSGNEGVTDSPTPFKRTSYVDTSFGPLRKLLDEAADLIDSPSFSRIHLLILDSMFSNLIDQKTIPQLYPQSQSSATLDASSHPRIQELDSAVTIVPTDPRVKLASILAVFTRQAHAIGNGSNPPNDYLNRVDAEVRELDSFAAVIYTSNLEAGIEQSQQQRTDTSEAPGSRLKSSMGIGMSDVGKTSPEDMVESKLESAWEKVTGTTIASR